MSRSQIISTFNMSGKGTLSGGVLWSFKWGKYHSSMIKTGIGYKTCQFKWQHCREWQAGNSKGSRENDMHPHGCMTE